MTDEMRGKVAIVTGGGAGIGLAAAEKLAREGASVVICSDREDQATQAADGLREESLEVRGVRGDVTSSADMKVLVDFTVQTYGGVDVLVNSAGVQRYGTVTETDEEVWDEVLDVNLKGIYLAARHAIPEMRERGGGAIVNVSSVQAIASQAGVAAYTASKGGINALTRAMAVDHAETGESEIRTADQLVEHARKLKEEHGFTSHKLKGGVYPPQYELECYRALAGEFPEDTLRFDPNASFSVEEGIRFGLAIEDLNNDYYEDPTWGLGGMRRVREKVKIPLSTNTVVIDFEQLATNVLSPAADVILLDTTFWGGIRPCVKAAGVCETFQLGVAVHSSGELGIQLATMLHLGAALPNLSFSADAHYHHLQDDIIEGGMFEYEGGSIKVPDRPGLGVSLDRDKLDEYAELYKELGGYPYDRDPGYPGRYPLVPKQRFADPNRSITPQIPTGRTSNSPGAGAR